VVEPNSTAWPAAFPSGVGTAMDRGRASRRVRCGRRFRPRLEPRCTASKT
jgi:hypothetical protein